MKHDKDKLTSLQKLRAARDRRRKHNSTDKSPHYLVFSHPDNLFEIDYPAHWQVDKNEDGAVSFKHPAESQEVSIMIFRVPVQIDATVIEESGRWEAIATAFFAKVDSTNVRHDPTIVYSNYTADRPEPEQGGQRWFVLCADLIIGISTSVPIELRETYHPYFERMLSSMRIHRADEHLAVKILNRVTTELELQLPDLTFEQKGLKLVSDRFQFSVANLLPQAKRHPASLDSIVDHFVTGIVETCKAQDSLGKECWEDIQGRIQPLIKSDMQLQDLQDINKQAGRPGAPQIRIANIPWLADIRICFAIDDTRTFRLVTEFDVERWNVAIDDLYKTAISNLSAFPDPTFHVMALSDDTPRVGAVQPHGGAASSYLLHPHLFRMVAPKMGKRLLAAIPSRDALMIFEDRGPKDFLRKAVSQDYESTNHPISDRLFRITPDGIALV